jgi:hypothetical protein
MQMVLGSRRTGPRGAVGSQQQAESVGALPAPNDPMVRVTVAGGELLAVAQFEGYITPTSAEAARAALLAALRRGRRQKCAGMMMSHVRVWSDHTSLSQGGMVKSIDASHCQGCIVLLIRATRFSPSYIEGFGVADGIKLSEEAERDGAFRVGQYGAGLKRLALRKVLTAFPKLLIHGHGIHENMASHCFSW